LQRKNHDPIDESSADLQQENGAVHDGNRITVPVFNQDPIENKKPRSGFSGKIDPRLKNSKQDPIDPVHNLNRDRDRYYKTKIGRRF
jgi:hypothetical protein